MPAQHRDADWLNEALHAVDFVYFLGAVRDMGVKIKWGRAARPAKRSLRYGCYHFGRRLIEINPILKLRVVPDEFVLHILHHEMIHAYMGESSWNGKTHSDAFLLAEKMFIHYTRAKIWEHEYGQLMWDLKPPTRAKP